MKKKKIVTVEDDFYGCESGCIGVNVYVNNEKVGFEFNWWNKDAMSKRDFIISMAMESIRDFNDHDYKIDIKNSDLRDGGLDDGDPTIARRLYGSA